MARSVAEDGASTLSREWRAGQRKDWFIENQRGGADLVEAGVVLHDHKLVDAGLRELEWGYARQTTRGFIHSAARSLKFSETESNDLLEEMSAGFAAAVEPLLAKTTLG